MQLLKIKRKHHKVYSALVSTHSAKISFFAFVLKEKRKIIISHITFKLL